MTAFSDARHAAQQELARRFPLDAKRDQLRKCGAWAGPSWFCKCRGVLHDESEGRCRFCNMQRPSVANWFKQSALYAELAKCERDNRAVKYLHDALVSIAVREGLEAVNEAFPYLFAAVARDKHMSFESLAVAWGVPENAVPVWVARNVKA